MNRSRLSLIRGKLSLNGHQKRFLFRCYSHAMQSTRLSPLTFGEGFEEYGRKHSLPSSGYAKSNLKTLFNYSKVRRKVRRLMFSLPFSNVK